MILFSLKRCFQHCAHFTQKTYVRKAEIVQTHSNEIRQNRYWSIIWKFSKIFLNIFLPFFISMSLKTNSLWETEGGSSIIFSTKGLSIFSLKINRCSIYKELINSCSEKFLVLIFPLILFLIQFSAGMFTSNGILKN